MFVSKIINRWSSAGRIPAFRAARILERNACRTMSLLPSPRGAQTSETSAADSKSRYPGLGLPLREYSPSAFDFPFFPIGAHGSCYGSESLPLPVREVAMMGVMDALTDKPDWHIKVNDDLVVSKWRAEALAMPNNHWWDLTCHIEHPEPYEGYVKIPENIMSGDAFDCVSLMMKRSTMACKDTNGAQCIRSCEARPIISKRAAWSLPSTLTRWLSSLTP